VPKNTEKKGCLSRLRKTLVAGHEVSGHDFTGCGKTLFDAGFVTGHDFSRATKGSNERAGFSPCYGLCLQWLRSVRFSAAYLVVPQTPIFFRAGFSPCHCAKFPLPGSQSNQSGAENFVVAQRKKMQK
jgi:hypothetical protein